jgi:hypothetical protein
VCVCACVFLVCVCVCVCVCARLCNTHSRDSGSSSNSNAAALTHSPSNPPLRTQSRRCTQSTPGRQNLCSRGRPRHPPCPAACRRHLPSPAVVSTCRCRARSTGLDMTLRPPTPPHVSAPRVSAPRVSAPRARTRAAATVLRTCLARDPLEPWPARAKARAVVTHASV